MTDEILDKKAVALRYDMEEDDAPKVVAKGKGYVADRIETIARETGIPIKEDKQLVEYLNALNLYEEIPAQLYGVIAEILAFVYQMDKKQR